MRLAHWLTCIAVSLLPFLALPAQAAGTLDKIRSSKSISFGYREASIPFSFTGDDNQPSGYAVDLCLRIAAAVVKQLDLDELQLHWVAVTPATRTGKLRSDQIDVECGATTSSLSRMAEVDFSLPIFADGASYLYRRTSGIRRVDDLARRKVAVATATASERILAETLVRHKLAAEVIKVDDHQQGLTALLDGRVDAYFADRSLLIGLALDAGQQSDWSLGQETFSYEPYALMLRRNDADFRLLVNRELARLYRSREIIAIHDRWFGFLGKPGSQLESLYQINALPE